MQSIMILLHGMAHHPNVALADPSPYPPYHSLAALLWLDRRLGTRGRLSSWLRQLMEDMSLLTHI